MEMEKSKLTDFILFARFVTLLGISTTHLHEPSNNRVTLMAESSNPSLAFPETAVLILLVWSAAKAAKHHREICRVVLLEDPQANCVISLQLKCSRYSRVVAVSIVKKSKSSDITPICGSTSPKPWCSPLFFFSCSQVGIIHAKRSIYGVLLGNDNIGLIELR